MLPGGGVLLLDALTSSLQADKILFDNGHNRYHINIVVPSFP